jgi:outer membrane protein assembly factor BamB
MPTIQPSPDRSNAERTTQPRWWPAIVILTLGIGRLLWIWNVWVPDRTVQTIHSYLTGIPTLLLLGIWWFFLSRLSWRIRGIGVAIVVLTVALLACVLRFDDVTGEVFPMFAWRWTPRRAALTQAYFQEQRQRQRDRQRQPASRTLHETNVPAATDVEGPLNEDPRVVNSPDNKKVELTDADWPAFRGRFRDGIVRGTEIRTDWDAKPPVALWRHPVGPGWSSFSVVNGLAYTQEQRFDDQDRDAEAVVCYDVMTGEQRWEHQDLGMFSHTLGGNGPRATPTWYEGLLYSFGATGILNCLDAQTGKKIWSHDVLVENKIHNAEYGMAGSPLVYGDVVVVNPGGTEGKSLMAFNRLTGRLAWEQGADKAGYASPQISEVDGKPQLLTFDAVGIAGDDLATGQNLWKFPWTNNSGINAAQPIIPAKDQVLVSVSYGVGSVLLQVRHSTAGWKAEPLWESKQIRMKFNCGVFRDQFLFCLDEGILACFDLRDGRKKWKGGRYSFGQMLLIDDKLLILAESGDVVLVAADPDHFQELTRFQAIEGKSWNNPTLWKGLLIVRNSSEAACYDLRIE